MVYIVDIKQPNAQLSCRCQAYQHSTASFCSAWPVHQPVHLIFIDSSLVSFFSLHYSTGLITSPMIKTVGPLFGGLPVFSSLPDCRIHQTIVMLTRLK